jgi:hypothetical protein
MSHTLRENFPEKPLSSRQIQSIIVYRVRHAIRLQLFHAKTVRRYPNAGDSCFPPELEVAMLL